MKRIFLLFTAVTVLAACNTFQGVGKDVKKAGEAIESAAKR